MGSANTVENRYQAFGLSFAAGFASFSAQIIYLREVLSLLPQNEVIISFYFAIYLLASGAGAYILRRVNYRKLFLWFTPFFLISLLSLRPILKWSIYVPGQLPPLKVYIIALLILIPFSLVSGGFFSSLSDEFRKPALVYGADAIGSFTAALFLYLFFLPRFPSYISASFATAIFLLLMLLFKLRTQAILALLLAVPLLFLERPSWSRLFSPLKLVEEKESPYGKITLTEYNGVYTIWENGEKLYDFPPTPAEKLSYLPLINGGKKVLLIGGGGRCLKYLKKVKGIEVTYVEPNPALTEVARRFFNMKGVKIALTDGREFVRKTREKFDLAIIDLPPPTSSSATRFYTVEFFSSLKRISLRVALSLASGNYYSDVDSKIISSVYYSVKRAFPVVKAAPGNQLVLIGSSKDFNLSPESYENFLKINSITPEIYFPIQLSFETNELEMEKFHSAIVKTEPNTDGKPVSYVFSLVKWIRHYSPGFPMVRKNFLWLLPLAFFLILPFFKSTPSLSMGMISFSAFAYELLLLLLFQYQRGYFYLQVSLLAGLVMFALGLGSIFFKKKYSIIILALLPILIILVQKPSLAIFYTLFFLLGFLEGGSFGFLSGKTKNFSSLYFSDLLGSSISGFSIGLVLVPFLGFRGCLIGIFLILVSAAFGFKKMKT